MALYLLNQGLTIGWLVLLARIRQVWNWRGEHCPRWNLQPSPSTT